MIHADSSALSLDHLVIGARTLDEGRDYVRDVLGIDVPLGGRHTHMGTHNRLVGLGGRRYLEIIAIDPEQPAPGRARWFGLDDPVQRARRLQRPRLIAWVAGSIDLDATVAACPVDMGPVADMQRGDFRWRMAVRVDGALIEGGCVPVCLQWPDGIHPADGMADSGCRVDGLTVQHPAPDALRAILRDIGALELVDITPAPMPGLTATVTAPNGNTAVLD